MGDLLRCLLGCLRSWRGHIEKIKTINWGGVSCTFSPCQTPGSLLFSKGVASSNNKRKVWWITRAESVSKAVDVKNVQKDSKIIFINWSFWTTKSIPIFIFQQPTRNEGVSFEMQLMNTSYALYSFFSTTNRPSKGAFATDLDWLKNGATCADKHVSGGFTGFRTPFTVFFCLISQNSFINKSGSRKINLVSDEINPSLLGA